MNQQRAMLPYYVAALVGAIVVFVVSLLTDSVVTAMLAGLVAGIAAGGVIAFYARRTSPDRRRR